ncbi:hypothetical protein LCGC14_0913510 [marine sediment metagenome]|uniref:Zona occludens toxin N-terminal domain-containing protein n=1 Tax=marine sediment metagenome TaxID=412755 RepID=A0A0F9RZK7_9ZZZZ
MYLPKVFLIEGIPGKGKTLTALYLCLYHQINYGLHIYSTVELYNAADCSCGGQHPIERDSYYCGKEEKAFLGVGSEFVQEVDYTHLPNFKAVYDKLEEAKKDPEAFADGSFLLDEGQKFLNRRLSTSKINRILNELLGDYRKCRLDLYLTCHHRTHIDKSSLRYITHFAVPKIYPAEDLCVVRVEDIATDRIMKFQFRPSSIYPFYKTTERVITGGKYSRMKTEDLQ